MLRTFHPRAAFMVAAAGAAIVLGAGSALAVGGWTVAATPPTGQNSTLTGVATVSDSDAWAVGYHSDAAGAGRARTGRCPAAAYPIPEVAPVMMTVFPPMA